MWKKARNNFDVAFAILKQRLLRQHIRTYVCVCVCVCVFLCVWREGWTTPVVVKDRYLNVAIFYASEVAWGEVKVHTAGVTDGFGAEQE